MKKMKKLSRTSFLIVSYLILSILAILWAFTWYYSFPGDSIRDGESEFGAVHIVFNVITISIWLVLIGVVTDEWGTKSGSLLQNFYKDNSYKEEEEINIKKYNKLFIWGIVIFLVYFLFSGGKVIFKQSYQMYNKSKICHNNYIQKVQERKGFFDQKWLVYTEKRQIADFVTKDVFITVTKIIMENRKDGEKLTWKWLQENQQIPYNEFTKFYTDLSDFVTSWREGYFVIETQCQTIANQNNTLLDTFPHNVYNKFLGCDKINFQYGYLSDSTEKLFKKRENVQ